MYHKLTGVCVYALGCVCVCVCVCGLPRGRVESWLSLRFSDVSSAALEKTPSGTFVIVLCSIDSDWREMGSVLVCVCVHTCERVCMCVD